MYQAAVIYAPASPEMSALAERIASRLEKERLQVVCKEASRTVIPDLTAADLVVLGSAGAAGGRVHEDFSELLRALKGISLAGRAVGAFAVGGADTLRSFEQGLADCEVPLEDRRFVEFPVGQVPDSRLEPWLESLVEQLGERETTDRGR